MVAIDPRFDIDALYDTLRLADEFWAIDEAAFPGDVRAEYLGVRVRFLALLRDIKTLKDRLASPDALARALRSNDQSTDGFVGDDPSRPREASGNGPTSGERVVVPLRTSAPMVWRQAAGSNTWHFSDRCSQWPAELFAELSAATRPETGHVCDECVRGWRTTWLGALPPPHTDAVCCRGPRGEPMDCRP